MGYAFINFLDPKYIIKFYNDFHEKKWPHFNSEKVRSVYHTIDLRASIRQDPRKISAGPALPILASHEPKGD
jgi:hypothetical protein